MVSKMAKAQPTLATTPIIKPIKVPMPTLPADSKLRRAQSSPSAAPTNGPKIRPGRAKNRPNALVCWAAHLVLSWASRKLG